MGNRKRPRDNSRHTLDSIFQVLRVVLNYRKGQKQLKKLLLHPKSTSARPPIYDRAKPEKLSTASPGNPMSITRPSSFVLCVQPDQKSFWKSHQRLSNLFFDNFRQQIHDKSSLAVRSCIKTNCFTRCLNRSSNQVLGIN